MIRSEDPDGTRGHTAYTHRADVRIAYVEFRDLGRTKAAKIHQTAAECAEAAGFDPPETCNHVGRYPVHIHHLWGVPNPTPDDGDYQFELRGNSVVDSLKWPIAVHASHFGLVVDNVVFGGDRLTGAGIAVEEGSETGNVFQRNFVAVIRGDINPRESGTDSTGRRRLGPARSASGRRASTTGSSTTSRRPAATPSSRSSRAPASSSSRPPRRRTRSSRRSRERIPRRARPE